MRWPEWCLPVLRAALLLAAVAAAAAAVGGCAASARGGRGGQPDGALPSFERAFSGDRADDAPSCEADEWVLVDEDPATLGLSPEGARYRPGARVLVRRRIVRAPEELAVRIEISGGKRAAAQVGDEVEGDVWIENGHPEMSYEIEVSASGGFTHIVGPSRFVVRGTQRARIRFTRFTSGEGGIRVTCRPMARSPSTRPAAEPGGEKPSHR